MLTFNQSGLLVPDNKIHSSIEELQLEFVTNIPTTQRERIFESYVKYNEDFKKTCDINLLHQWINGSYVSKKRNPGDIDLVTFLDFEIVRKLGSKLNDFKFPNSEKIYGVDAYIVEKYPEDHKDRFRYVSDLAYWMDRFTKTRRIRGNKLSKGFLEISF